ncbi:MAG TPA: aquaporin [Thermoplasmata archaeon]|nr:aquaporin [Thermoplasmata archaeon]
MAYSLGQKALAEFVGTFGLLSFVTGAALFTIPDGAFDPAGRVLLISLSLGLGVMGMAYALGDISGASFNPAITVAQIVRRRVQPRDGVVFIVAQVVGGVVAVGVIAGVAYGYSALWNVASGSTVALASQGYSGNGSPYSFGVGSVFLLEVVMTFFLVAVVLFVTRPNNSTKNLAPVGIALTLAMTNLVAIPVDGASVNPARSFAPAILSSMWTGDRWAIEQDWLFWVAPILGGLIAAIVDWSLSERSAAT